MCFCCVLLMSNLFKKIWKIKIFIKVLTAMAKKIYIFWIVTPCSPLKVNRNFRGRIFCLLSVSCCFLPWYILRSRRWRQCVSQKCGLTSKGLYVLVYQKIKLVKIGVFFYMPSPTRQAKEIQTSVQSFWKCFVLQVYWFFLVFIHLPLS
jgi:hypothetical protein